MFLLIETKLHQFSKFFLIVIVQKCRCSLWSSNPIFISSANYIQVFDFLSLDKSVNSIKVQVIMESEQKENVVIFLKLN